MPSPDITVTHQGAVTHIRMNRPAKRNALTADMYAAMADALAGAETSDTAVVLISGEGLGFTAGNDLNDFVSNPPQDEHAPVHRFLNAIASSTRILVAAVQGRAVGVGTTMLLHCDFVVAEETAELRMPFVDLALVPEAASSLLVPRAVGHIRAAELLLLAEPLAAPRAQALGLVSRVVPEGAALAEAQKLIGALLGKPRGALLATKALMKSRSDSVPARMAEENVAFKAQLQTQELKDNIAGFFAARAGKAA